MLFTDCCLVDRLMGEWGLGFEPRPRADALIVPVDDLRSTVRTGDRPADGLVVGAAGYVHMFHVEN